MRHAIEAARMLCKRCVVCGKPIRTWDKQLHVGGPPLHYACGTHHPNSN
jgi:hypothetical protein